MQFSIITIKNIISFFVLHSCDSHNDRGHRHQSNNGTTCLSFVMHVLLANYIKIENNHGNLCSFYITASFTCFRRRNSGSELVALHAKFVSCFNR